MIGEASGPHPNAVANLNDLARELDQLRCRAARGTRKARVSLRELADRTDLPHSTVHAYVSGKTLPPVEVLDQLVIALGATPAEQGQWSDAWFRIVKLQHEQRRPGPDPARVADEVPRQLPPAPGAFAGRHDELGLLTSALDAVAGAPAISAITGAGGIGKSWLALHWAHQNLHRFPDGQLFVDLRGFTPEGEPMAAGAAVRGFLDALGVEPARIPVDLDSQAGLYRSLVAGKRMLILLDNARNARQLMPLLPGSPTCTVLVTSRDQLAGLLTGHGARPLTLDVLDDRDARDLLARRLGLRRLDAEPDVVADLLACCAGLPLALGIVASRAAAHPGLHLATWAGELRDTATRLGALDWGEPAASLPAVLSWSYNSLSPAHARALGLLGLAPGPDIGLPAAANLIGLSPSQTGDVLRTLEQMSLLQRQVPTRWSMHDLVRLYASEQADRDLPRNQVAAALRRLTDFYLHTAYAGERLLEPHRPPIELGEATPRCRPQAMSGESAAIAWFSVEHPNLLAVQRFAAERSWHTAAWQLAWTLNSFHQRHGHLRTHIAVWRTGVAAATRLADPATLTLAHRRLGDACALAGQYPEAGHHLRHALTLAEQAGDLRAQAYAHYSFVFALERQGDGRQALAHATQALRLFQGLDDPVWEAHARNALGSTQSKLGQLQEARTHCEAALALLRRHRDRGGEAATLDSLGSIAHLAGQHALALDHYRQALALRRDLGNSYEEADTLDRLAATHQTLGQHDQARHTWHQALTLYQAQQRTTDVDRVQQQLDNPTRQPVTGP